MVVCHKVFVGELVGHTLKERSDGWRGWQIDEVVILKYLINLRNDVGAVTLSS